MRLYPDENDSTCGEQWDVILDTVAGAALQDYPSNSYRVFVLDDANDSSISHSVDEFNRKECEKLGIQPVIYLSRLNKSGIVRHHKAGNLEYGIRISREQYGGSEFIAGLDADMIPESDWLKRLVPHLLYSSKTAIVSPPQYFYNIPDTDHLAQDANVLQQVLEPVRDPVGCSMCHGSGYVMRRKALDDIGGWPLVNIGEDVLCSYQLNRAGWQTAFVQDKLQFGMAPQSFHAYVTQRMRWVSLLYFLTCLGNAANCSKDSRELTQCEEVQIFPSVLASLEDNRSSKTARNDAGGENVRMGCSHRADHCPASMPPSHG
jgi:cellulose synthase/poly-beta-1,6-N-acetylglucosamine synthase-like glycosyltransferase